MPFTAYRVYIEDGKPVGRIETLDENSLPDGELTIAVTHSSVNYKDALSARGRPGVTRRYPHIPGIDAVGRVIAVNEQPHHEQPASHKTDDGRQADDQAAVGHRSTAQATGAGLASTARPAGGHASAGPATHRFSPGDRVIVTGFDFGVNTPGGFGSMIRVPADWAIPLPERLSPLDAMRFGTAGFTAGLSLLEIERSGVEPGSRPVLVTGSCGGVGSVAIGVLHAAGFTVHAATRSPEESGERLRSIGADEVVATDVLVGDSEKALAKGQWAAAIDTVGGSVLSGALAGLQRAGVATACGLVGGSRFNASVMPFILRGVRLVGIDSAYASRADRSEVWSRLAGPWRPEALAAMSSEVELDGINAVVDLLLDGKHRGRTVVTHGGNS